VCWIMGLTVAIAIVTKTNGVKAYICYITKILLRCLLILSKKASKGSVTSESKSVTSPVTRDKKNADFEGFIGKEGDLFFSENLQGPYKHVFNSLGASGAI
jgi:hypothetical protein